MISENGVPKIRRFFRCAPGPKNGCLILSLFFVRSCAERTSLRSRFASFWVDLFSPSVDVQEIEAQRGNNSMAASVGRIHFSLTSLLVFVSSAALLQIPFFFFSRCTPSFFSALRVRSASRISKNSPPARGGSLFRRPLDSLSQLAGGCEHCRPSASFYFFFLCRHLVCRGS